MRIILGTNHPVSGELHDRLFAHDLVARLHRVSLPPLRSRRADIADIFLDVMRRTGDLRQARRVEAAFEEELMERLLRRSYHQGNVRELEDMAAVMVARVAAGEPPRQAVLKSLVNEEPTPVAVPLSTMEKWSSESRSRLVSRCNTSMIATGSPSPSSTRISGWALALEKERTVSSLSDEPRREKER